MNRLNSSLDQIKTDIEIDLKSEEAFDEFKKARKKLDENLNKLNKTIEKLQQEQFNNINFKL